MKTIFTLIILAFSVCSFGQKLSESDINKAMAESKRETDQKLSAKFADGTDDTALTAALFGKRDKAMDRKTELADTMTIRLQPYQKQILSKLDSIQKAFSADVERNKYAIETFNALMQRSNAIQERSKDAQDLIFGDHGIDPKKYRITGADLIKGTLKIERIK